MDSDSEDSFEFEVEDETTHVGGDGSVVPNSLSRSQAWNLYVSHAFSTWNARGYEFAAVCVPREKRLIKLRIR